MEPGDAVGEELPGLGDLRPAVHGGERVAPPDPGAADHEGELPAAVRRHDLGASPSSHQQAAQTGLHSPIRVTSETMSYRACGERATTMDSEYCRLLMSSGRLEHRGHALAAADAHGLQQVPAVPAAQLAQAGGEHP